MILSTLGFRHCVMWRGVFPPACKFQVCGHGRRCSLKYQISYNVFYCRELHQSSAFRCPCLMMFCWIIPLLHWTEKTWKSNEQMAFLFSWNAFNFWQDSWGVDRKQGRERGDDMQQRATRWNRTCGHCSEDKASVHGAPAPLLILNAELLLIVK